MDAVVKVFCVYGKRKRQYSFGSSDHTQVKLKKRGSGTKYLATVLATGTDGDIVCVAKEHFLDCFSFGLIIATLLTVTDDGFCY
ncbi:unnamed protein product [Eruca vesicaria subsp. sativa]|uniref:Uncharacterized protein n=1 Tax=Eruca vesicaria subsp. sativa TaxID=29727 RepID=A0ABC8JY70_ERUVS|nr:unnamed protein product [Eruca vesicaria subsp. sativa]